VGYSSPIGGRMAWTGLQSSFITTRVNLPATMAGQSVKLRFRMASDESEAKAGWYVDTVNVTSKNCCGGAPTPTPTATPTPAPTPVNVITDGGFEGSVGQPTNAIVMNPNWASTSTRFGTSICTFADCGSGGGTAGPRAGNAWIWFDAADAASAETGTVSQTVTVPAGTTATLNYFMRFGFITAPSSSVLSIRMDGNIIQTINEPGSAESAYSLKTLNLSAFADGAPHVLQFHYFRPAGTTGADNLTIDDVSLLITSTAAQSVTISGRVLTPDSRAIRNASVSISSASGVTRSTITNSFGFYQFNDVATGENYTVRAAARRYRFANRVITLAGALTDLDFIGLE
ncbi:MAG: carboxypeptidase regulatory-like domain-containing protein, partial [Pyrinomonadaceae bacterium]